MKTNKIKVKWPNGKSSIVNEGQDWLTEAQKAGVCIPTGCLTGSCGACEIEVNGEVTRACINSIPHSSTKEINVEFSYDPFW